MAKVGHDLIDHAVAGEQILHLTGGFFELRAMMKTFCRPCSTA